MNKVMNNLKNLSNSTVIPQVNENVIRFHLENTLQIHTLNKISTLGTNFSGVFLNFEVFLFYFI